MDDHITLEETKVDRSVFDVNALVEYLQQINDQRNSRGFCYPLHFIMSVIVFAKLSGQNKPSAIAEWAKLRRRQLVTAFNCKRETVPSLNQKHLQEDVEQFFIPPRKAPGWNPPVQSQDVAQTTQKGHGRLKQRTLTAIVDESEYIDWPGLRQVFKLERKVTHSATSGITVETAYAITSLPPEKGSASQLLEWTQSHWGIENGLHYRRDVTLNEDATRMSDANQAEVMSILNNFVIGLTTKLGFKNLASAQRVFEAKLTFSLSAYI